MTIANEGARAPDSELTINRVFDAPPAVIFAIMTTPKHMKGWWGPRGYTTLSADVDLRPGGAWRVHSRHDDGTEMAERGMFREVAEAQRLVFTHAWEGEGGKPGRETTVTITFAEQAGKTLMTFHQAYFTSVATRDGHIEGWNESFDMLAEHLEHV